MNGPPTTDGERLAAIAAGELTAFDAFVDTYRDRLIAFIARRLRDAHAAEDLAQETFLRAFRAARAGGYTAQASVTTWLFTIAGNCVIDHQRSTMRRERRVIVTAPPRPTESPDERAMVGERDAILRGALNELPDEQRQVIEMKLFDGLSFGEIAELLGCPTPTVKSRMAYGLRKVQQALRPHGQEAL